MINAVTSQPFELEKPVVEAVLEYVKTTNRLARGHFFDK